MYNFIEKPQAQVIDKNQTSYEFGFNKEDYMRLIDFKTLPENFAIKVDTNCMLKVIDFNSCKEKLTDRYSISNFKSSFTNSVIVSEVKCLIQVLILL